MMQKMTDPIMMKYTYSAFPGGVMLPVGARSRAAANWEGDLAPQGEVKCALPDGY